LRYVFKLSVVQFMQTRIFRHWLSDRDSAAILQLLTQKALNPHTGLCPKHLSSLYCSSGLQTVHHFSFLASRQFQMSQSPFSLLVVFYEWSVLTDVFLSQCQSWPPRNCNEAGIREQEAVSDGGEIPEADCHAECKYCLSVI
jgi:hypothetical protein